MLRSNLIVGLDIGSSKIVTLVGQYYPEEERLNIIGVANFPAEGMRKGQIVDIEKATQSMIKSIEAAERMANYSITEAFVSISAPHISSLNSQGVVAVSNPTGEITDEDVERVIEGAKAVSLPSSQEILHVIPRNYTVDGQSGVIDPVGMAGVRLEVESHIVTASTPALRNLSKCLDESGIKILDYVFSGFACAESVLTPTEKELGVILVDMGASITTLTIYHEGAPTYSAVIPIGAKNVTNDLAIGLRLSLDEAEKLKLKLNTELDNDEEVSLKELGVSESTQKVSLKTAINGIVAPRLEEIFKMIGEKIRESGFGGATPAGVVLTGGGARTARIKYNCQHALGLPVRIAVPKEVGGIVDELLTPDFSSSIGLILYGVNKQRAQSILPHRMFDLGKIRGKLPIKGAVQRLGEILKPLLP